MIVPFNHSLLRLEGADRHYSAAMPLTDVRPVLKRQYHASLAMLREAIERCPDDLWLSSDRKNAFWQISYHTLFYTHMYLHEGEASFRPWVKHQANVQNPSGLVGQVNKDPSRPFADPYSKSEVLEFWSLCDTMVDSALDRLDLDSASSGFSWYPIGKLEHQLVNIRHIQHHSGQLIDRLRASCDVGVAWAGSRL